MKYMVPEINISKFSEENIVTLSSTGKANSALAQAMSSADIAEGNQKIVNTTINDWIAQ